MSRKFAETDSCLIDHLTPLVHEPTIRAQITGALPIAPGASSIVLFNMIFALGEYDKAETPTSPSGERYYHVARAALQTTWLEEGSVEMIQGLALMAIYLQYMNKPNAGYLCLGTSIRMAVALGLHLPSRIGLAGGIVHRTSVLRSEMRTRIWCSLVTLEVGCAVTFGRPNAVAHSQLKSIPPPINCEDQSLTVSTTLPPTDIDRPTMYSALIVQVHLAKATCLVYDRILHCHRAPTLEQIQWCDKQIANAAAHLPPTMITPPTRGPCNLALAVQVWRTRDQRAILYRPVLLAAAWSSSQYHLVDPKVGDCIQ